MKIGFSLGRCIRDLVNGTVEYDEVVVIVAATRVTYDSLSMVIDQYMHRQDYLEGLDSDECLRVAQKLFEDGKVHQPRLFDAHISAPGNLIWMDLIPIASSSSPADTEAWVNYLVSARLRGEVTKMNAEDEKLWKFNNQGTA